MEEKKYNALAIELEILKFWEIHKTHEKISAKNKGKEKFYFLDGPPYTSGVIHLGTAWNKTLKDSILRYKRMQGFDVWDRAGYDMHGMPTELKVQSKLGLKHKDDIVNLGIGKFVTECKDFCITNLKQMNKDFIRLGVWMDFDNAYQSITPDFMEGEWWLIKKAHENKRLYLGKKVMHWCSSCSTSLAKHELEYENVVDNSIFVKFKVKGKENEYLIIWTTTPWTIPFNLGVMVHPEYDYIKAKVDKEVWIVAKNLAAPLIQVVAEKDYAIIEEFKGKQLKGLKYIHPFSDIIKDYNELEKIQPKVHTVVMSEEYVTLDAGSGLVHMAPGCGPEDYEVGYREGILPYNTIDEEGIFPEGIGPLSHLTAKKDDKRFIEELKARNAIIGETKVEHEYAHCWRCRNPVVFRTTEQWFFKVEDLKEQMKELNKNITWIPDFAGSRQFNSWLDNLRDNGITRQRFWGTPLPIWICGKCKGYDVIGSIKELKEKAGNIPKDLHKPWIDEIKWPCNCGGVKVRSPDILDVWIDAGTTSWNCLNFPKQKDLFEKLWPADFILEGKDQIRGWFNLLFVASMVSMQKPSFKKVYMHGFINDKEGRKMSKSLGNVISPYEVIDKFGADTFRYYAIGSASPGMDMNYNQEDVKLKNKNLLVLWNLHNFLIDYSKSVKLTAPKQQGIEERYILSRLNSAIKEATESFDSYELPKIPWAVEDLFLELSRTYIQLVREKSAFGEDFEKEAILYTVYTCMIETLKMLSPIIPFAAEKMYQDLKAEFKLDEESVHSFAWPKYDGTVIDESLEHDVNLIKDIIASILAAREKVQLGVKWPLKDVTVVSEDEDTRKAAESLMELIKNQTNVKEIIIKDKFEEAKYSIKPNFKTIGQTYGSDVAKIIAHFATVSHDAIIEKIKKNGKYIINLGNKDAEIKMEHLLVEHTVPEHLFAVAFSKGMIYVNKDRDELLESEGYSREIMRRVQNMRKDAGLQRMDGINLVIVVEGNLAKRLHGFHKSISEKVGATSLKIETVEPTGFMNSSTDKIKGKEIKIFFNKV